MDIIHAKLETIDQFIEAVKTSGTLPWCIVANAIGQLNAHRIAVEQVLAFNEYDIAAANLT